MHRGYWKHWRKAKDSKYWSRGVAYRGLFATILNMANYKTGYFLGHEIKPGQCATSINHLANDCGVSVKGLRLMLEKLIEDGMIKAENRANRFTLLTVVNWAIYQSCDDEKGKPSTHQSTQLTTQPGANQGQTEYTQSKNEKKEDNLKEGKEEERPPISLDPSADERVNGQHQEFLTMFCQLTGKKILTLNYQAASQLSDLIRAGYTQADFETAVRNCLKDDWTLKKNRAHLTPAYITQPDRFEKFLNGFTPRDPDAEFIPTIV